MLVIVCSFMIVSCVRVSVSVRVRVRVRDTLLNSNDFLAHNSNHYNIMGF